MNENDDDELPEISVEEQVSLMYLGTVDEEAASVIAQRILLSVMPIEVDAAPPRNADVLYALITALTSMMARMGGTVEFRATILRGFGDICAGQLRARMAQKAKPKTRAPKTKPAVRKEPEAKPDDEPEAQPDDEPQERGPPKPYTERAGTDVDVYTLAEFRKAALELDDRAGHAYQAVKLGSGLVYYAPDRRVKASSFDGPDEPRVLPGTSHIAWITK